MPVTDSKWGELIDRLDKALFTKQEFTQQEETQDMADNRRDDDRWKLDKHIPVAVIFTIVAQGLAGVWWVSGLQHSVQDHERRLVAQEAAKVAERMAVVEVQMRDNRDLQLEMNRKLDRLVDVKGLNGRSLP
jgi:hypothetical protein